ETMAKMAQQFMRAASIGNSVEGLLRTLPPQGQDLLNKVTSAMVSQLNAQPGDVQAPAGDGAGVAANSGNGAGATTTAVDAEKGTVEVTATRAPKSPRA